MPSRGGELPLRERFFEHLQLRLALCADHPLSAKGQRERPDIAMAAFLGAVPDAAVQVVPLAEI